MPDNGWSSRTSAVSCSRLRLAGAALLSVVAAPLIAQARPPLDLVVVTAVTQKGHATDDWLAILRTRLSPAQYDSIAPLQKALAPDEAAWDSLIHARAPAWIGLAAPIMSLYSPAQPPAVVRVMVGNRGADDAFTADNHTIAFDLSRLVSIYGPASDPANGVRIDRFFRHEFSHILQKAWLAAHPWAITSPLNAALFDIWTEGLGNYYSLSDQWLDPQGQLTDRSRQTLAPSSPASPPISMLMPVPIRPAQRRSSRPSLRARLIGSGGPSRRHSGLPANQNPETAHSDVSSSQVLMVCGTSLPAISLRSLQIALGLRSGARRNVVRTLFLAPVSVSQLTPPRRLTAMRRAVAFSL